jgi:uncharacterized protein YfcZ (UPF0381/DUF406 family)
LNTTPQAKASTSTTPATKNGKVLLCNDSDGEYEQIFGNREELQRFVDHLMVVADEAWNEYCEASLDLSNQDEVGEGRSYSQLWTIFTPTTTKA